MYIYFFCILLYQVFHIVFVSFIALKFFNYKDTKCIEIDGTVPFLPCIVNLCTKTHGYILLKYERVISSCFHYMFYMLHAEHFFCMMLVMVMWIFFNINLFFYNRLVFRKYFFCRKANSIDFRFVFRYLLLFAVVYNIRHYSLRCKYQGKQLMLTEYHLRMKTMQQLASKFV